MSFNGGRAGPLGKLTREVHIRRPNRYAENNKVERLNGTLRERRKAARASRSPLARSRAGTPRSNRPSLR